MTAPAGHPIRIDPVLGNSQRLDGGAMFGNVPRAVWEKWAPPDDRHRITLACRALLVREESGRVVLCEAGIGAFFAPKLRDRFGVVEDRHVLLDSLAALGVHPADIDVVVLSHLHFDHAGGLLAAWSSDAAGVVAPATLVFPNASYVVSEAAWQRALHPHARDRASFIPELQPLLAATGRLERVLAGDEGTPITSTTLGPGYRLHLSDGHTPGLLLTEVDLPDGPLVFASDLVPGAAWVHLPVTMGYDRHPERLIDEKAALFADLVARGGSLFFTHDPDIASGRLAHVDGRYRLAPT
jgi:glyoxylase-like metal-dependent hydrolase (beta-lactamase superfamily II)